MSVQVIKRNGTVVDFDANKIRRALEKANNEVDPQERIPEGFIDEMIRLIGNGNRLWHVEDIQDIIERYLMDWGYSALAKKYITYRYQHKLIRESNSTDESILSLLYNENKEMEEENSNKNTKWISTQRDYIAGIVSRDVARRILLPPDVVEAHDRGVLHFHDMDYAIQGNCITNCCIINLGDMLDNGTCINGHMIESPKSFRTACTIATQIIACVASNQYGGQTISVKHLGKYLRRSKEKIKQRLDEYVPYILTDYAANDLLDKELREELRAGVQTIQYQINTLMTTNGQTPFVTLFLDLEPDDEYIEENAMIIEEILRQRLYGIKNEAGILVTPVFPKLVYVLREHNCLEGGKYDYLTKLAGECSAKRMYPDYISAKKMKENYDGCIIPPMGCRSFAGLYEDENGEYQIEGRGNQGVVSINLPQIGIIAKGDEEVFWKLLDERLELCKKALMFRHEQLENATSDVSPIHWQYGAIARLPKHAPIAPLLHDGYFTISLGYIGLYEVTKLMKGVSHTDPNGEEFALKVMKRLRKACDDWKEETGLGFALYGTPAESLCYRFAEIDKKRFGEIEDVTDKGYYTNSYHVDVREDIDGFTKFKFESQFQGISSGGCISYIEIPHVGNNLQAMYQLINFIYHNIQYAEFNTKSDCCQKCGFQGEILLDDNNEWYCPQCGNKDKDTMNVVRRVCGYLSSNFFNVGKTLEIKNRVMHIN